MRKLVFGFAAAAVLSASLAEAQTPSRPAAPETREVEPGIFSTFPILDRAEMFAARLEIKPGGTRRLHQHDDVQFHLFIPISGTVRMTMNGETIDAVVGQVYFLNKGTPHSFTNKGESSATALEVFVKPRE